MAAILNTMHCVNGSFLLYIEGCPERPERVSADRAIVCLEAGVEPVISCVVGESSPAAPQRSSVDIEEKRLNCLMYKAE